MKRLFVLLSVITLLSCTKERQAAGKKEIPEALKEKTMYRGSSREDLVDALYQELVAKSTELQQLESEIENLNIREAREGFDAYNNKSIGFYASAKYKATAIKDSITRKKMLDILEKSNTRYFEKSKEFNNLTKTMENKLNAIQDSYTILKIALTLPIIEKYQNENVPKKKAIEI